MYESKSLSKSSLDTLSLFPPRPRPLPPLPLPLNDNGRLIPSDDPLRMPVNAPATLPLGLPLPRNVDVVGGSVERGGVPVRRSITAENLP